MVVMCAKVVGTGVEREMSVDDVTHHAAHHHVHCVPHRLVVVCEEETPVKLQPQRTSRPRKSYHLRKASRAEPQYCCGGPHFVRG